MGRQHYIDYIKVAPKVMFPIYFIETTTDTGILIRMFASSSFLGPKSHYWLLCILDKLHFTDLNEQYGTCLVIHIASTDSYNVQPKLTANFWFP